MTTYLVFRLYGPLASWGQAAVGGVRPTGMQPTRSAIIGLLSAALGIKREQADELKLLNQSIKVAVKQTVPSSLLRDYHTLQVPSQKKGVIHRTRKSELSEDKLNTILSSRDYRCDGQWIVSIVLDNENYFSYKQLKKSLESPVYSLYMGRKSCVLAVPMKPQIIKTKTLKQALDLKFPPLTTSYASDKFFLNANGYVTYFWEGSKDEFVEENILTTQPWDEFISRERWQFKQRVMYQVTLKDEINEEKYDVSI